MDYTGCTTTLFCAGGPAWGKGASARASPYLFVTLQHPIPFRP